MQKKIIFLSLEAVNWLFHVAACATPIPGTSPHKMTQKGICHYGSSLVLHVSFAIVRNCHQQPTQPKIRMTTVIHMRLHHVLHKCLLPLGQMVFILTFMSSITNSSHSNSEDMFFLLLSIQHDLTCFLIQSPPIHLSLHTSLCHRASCSPCLSLFLHPGSHTTETAQPSRCKPVGRNPAVFM